MVEEKRKSVYLNQAQYDKLRIAKEAAQRIAGKNFSWGSFLVGSICGGILGAVIAGFLKKKKEGGDENGSR